MEQVTPDSTVMPTRQADTTHEHADLGTDAAVTRLLTRSDDDGAPPDRRALVAYSAWLYFERSFLCQELYPHLGHKAASFLVGSNAGFEYHRSGTPEASTRALTVLSEVGCDWTKDSYLGIDDARQGEAALEVPGFPHPDARLMDLERAFQVERAKYEAADAELSAANAEKKRRGELFVEADEALLMPRQGKFKNYWQAEQIRRALAGRFVGGTSKDQALFDATPRHELERILPLAEARESRLAILDLELGIEALSDAVDETHGAVDHAAEAVYRTPAHTFDGLAIKTRVLRISEPDLWKRPSHFTRVPCEWHEHALTEIADGVEHMLAHGQVRGDDEIYGGLHADLHAMTGGVDNNDGTVSFCDAAGKVLRRPVADWISFTAARLVHVAQTERARRLGDPALDTTSRSDLDKKLRQDLRTDAIHTLAFRPADAFRSAQAVREGRFDDEFAPPVVPAARNVSPDLIRAIEAHREAVQLMLHDPVNDDSRTDAHVAIIDQRRTELCQTKAKSLADLRYKVIYFWPDALQDLISDRAREQLNAIADDVLHLADAVHVNASPQEAEFLSLAPQLIKALERYDTLWDRTNEPYARAQEILEKRGPMEPAEERALEQKVFVETGYRVAYDAASEVSDEIDRLCGHLQEERFVSLEALVLRRRIGKSFLHLENDTLDDLDALWTAFRPALLAGEVAA